MMIELDLRPLRRAIPLTLLLLSTVAHDPAIARTPAGTTYAFAMRDMPLEAAVREYARITGRQVIFKSDTLKARNAPVLVGDYDADTALRLLLSGVPVRVEQIRAGVFVISPLTVSGPVAEAAGMQGQDRPEGVPDGDIVVTGTTIRGAQPAGAAVTKIDRKAIDRSGRSSVADVVALLPQNSGGTGSDAAVLGTTDRSSQNFSLGSSPNLRGLGSDATLTLINGRRQAGSGGRGDFTDLSGVPLAAVERIEVLKDGASAIYGSDAVGGVVNVILRDDYDGADTRLRSGVGTSGSPANYQASQLLGTTWRGGGVLAAYEYDYRGALSSADRLATRSADLRPLGGNDWRQYFSAPATILRFDPVAKAYVPAYAVPTYTDRPTRGDFAAGRNLENQFALTDTLPRQERHSVYLRAHELVVPGIELFGEARWARRAFSYAAPPSSSTYALTATNPYFVSPDGSPFSVVAYSFARDLGSGRSSGWVDSASLTAGITADLGPSWQLDAYYLFSRERAGDRLRNVLNSTAFSEALGGADNPATGFNAARDGYFNPYGSGSSNSVAVLAFIGSGRTDSWRRNSLQTAVAKFDGPLFALPAGTVRVAFGGAWRHEALTASGRNFTSGTAPVATTPAAASRSLGAGFGELSIPLMDGKKGFGLGRLLLSAAVRYERYSDFGGTANPKFGATWSLSPAVELRGAWGTSFRSPALPEIHTPFRISPTQLSSSSGATTPVLVLSGGNSSLRPETARTLSLGAVVRPTSRISLDLGYFRTTFDDRIDRPAVQNITRALTDPTLSPFVTIVDPVGNSADLARLQALAANPGATDVGFFPITSYRAIIDGRYVNTARVVVEGLDFDLRGAAELLSGTIAANVSVAYLLRFSQRFTPTAPNVDLSSTVGYPAKFKARSSVDWSDGTFGVTLSSTYVGSYRNTDLAPAPKAGAWLTFDLQLRASVGGKRGFAISLDARNVFDRGPPFVNRSTGVGYDPANADVLGRIMSFQVTKSW